ncbi:(S)-8-oxocitronellyl enol synthase CYC1 [Linum perenne]
MTTTATDKNPAAVALIVGVTGMSGLSLAEALNNPSTPGGPWKVYGVARRSLPTWFPAPLLHQFISVDALDQQDTLLKLSPVASEVTHVFWVALVVHESEEVNISTNSAMISNVVHALSGESSRLKHFALQTGTKHYMGPIFDPNHGSKLVVHGPPWQEDMPRLPYPNFYYAQEDVLASSLPKGVTHSIHRSSIIMGATPRSHVNSMLTLAIYATICKYKSLPFSNGDFFTWKEMWKVLCRVFELEFDEDEEGGFDVAGMMINDGMGRVWDEIMEKHGLVKTKLDEVTCFDAFTAVVRFEFQHVCSMNKSREFGFMGFYDTMKSVPYWVGRMREMKIIP